MEPNAFVAEVYRRMTIRTLEESPDHPTVTPPTEARTSEVAAEYAASLPADKNARILDIGYGNGWFLTACHKLGYRNLYGAEFLDPKRRPYLIEMGCELHEITSNIGDFLSAYSEHFDFIHLSHVIEHIPKHSLLWLGDNLFRSLRKGGQLYLRTPNMEGLTPNSSYYVTLAHEYGFAGSNLTSLLTICGFEDIRLSSPKHGNTLRQRVGAALRFPYLTAHRWKHRLFGVNLGGEFQTELIAMATRGDRMSLFGEEYR